MMLQFTPLKVHPEVPTYGGIMGDLTFVITMMGASKYHATAKRIGAKPYDGTRLEIGVYKRFIDAARACETFARAQHQ